MSSSSKDIWRTNVVPPLDWSTARIYEGESPRTSLVLDRSAIEKYLIRVSWRGEKHSRGSFCPVEKTFRNGELLLSEVVRRWRSKGISSSVTHVPAVPGLYALGHVVEVKGLEVSREFIYAGRTLNMRRRLSEHTHLTERNYPLESYLRRTALEVIVWYCTDFSAIEIEEAEKSLIKRLQPRFNRIVYK
jgi:hypothetical protein